VGVSITKDRREGVYRVAVSPEAVATVPEPIKFALLAPLSADHSQFAIRHSPSDRSPIWLISFYSPTPEGAEYVGRNHRFVAALARFLFEEALNRPGNATAKRCGALRTRAVNELTTVLLLRVRYLVEQPQARPLLSEEVLVLGFVGFGDDKTTCLDTADALRLLAEAKPDANMTLAEKRELVERALASLGDWNAIASSERRAVSSEQRAVSGEQRVEVPGYVREQLIQRARELEAAHRRIRQAVSLRVRGLEVKPQFPPDLLGILVLQPVVSR
jgi:hypothetical protein